MKNEHRNHIYVNVTDLDSMQLNVQIRELSGKIIHKSVTTRTDASLGASLENELCGLRSYLITGPSPNITWETPASTLKGVMLSVEKTAIPDGPYGSLPGGISHTVPNRSLPPNIPFTDTTVSSTSLNLTSGTIPKMTGGAVSQDIPSKDIYNDLSQRQAIASGQSKHHHIPNVLSCPSMAVDRDLTGNQPETQTLLKEYQGTINSLYSTGMYLSHTPPKDCFMAAADTSMTPLKRVAPSTMPRPPAHAMKMSDYIPHGSSAVEFTNPSPRPCKNNIAGSPEHVGKPSACVVNNVYVSHDDVPTSKCRPPKDKPVACVLQQRRDGYIDIMEKDARQRSQTVPNVTQPMYYNLMETERPPSKSEIPATDHRSGIESADSHMTFSPQPDLGNSATPPCIVSKGTDGYTTFAQQQETSMMEVDGDSFTENNCVTSDCDNKAPAGSGGGYFSSMENAISYCNPVPQSAPMLIQPSGDGYFGFSSPTNSSNSPQPLRTVLDERKPSGQDAFPHSESVSVNMPHYRRGSSGLIYAGIAVGEDEEQDADYTDMTQMSRISRDAHQNASAGALTYLDITPTESQYNYIDDKRHSSRALPPRPFPPLPMKRIRTRLPDPSTRDATETTERNTCDMDSIPGWCPSETEKSISSTMDRYKQEDGNFIVWWMSTTKRYVITVSHMGELRNYAIYQRRGGNGRLFIFNGGEDFENMKDLLKHYMREGLNGPELPSGESRGKRWQKFSHVKLRIPLNVHHRHKAVRKQAR